MKNLSILYSWLTLLSVLLLSLSSCAPSQPAITETQHELFENANVIVIRTSDDSETAFNEMIRILYEHGYRIASTDTYRMQIGTDVRIVSGAAGILGRRVNIDIDENQHTRIMITGRYNLQDRRGNRVASNRKISYRDTAPQMIKEMWEEMNQIALSYDQGQVLFIRQ